MPRWRRRLLPELALLLALAIAVAAAWNTGRAHPLVEWALGETPQTKLAAHLWPGSEACPRCGPGSPACPSPGP